MRFCLFNTNSARGASDAKHGSIYMGQGAQVLKRKHRQSFIHFVAVLVLGLVLVPEVPITSFGWMIRYLIYKLARSRPFDFTYPACVLSLRSHSFTRFHSFNPVSNTFNILCLLRNGNKHDFFFLIELHCWFTGCYAFFLCTLSIAYNGPN